MTAKKQQVTPHVIKAPGSSDRESHSSVFEHGSAWLRADFHMHTLSEGMLLKQLDCGSEGKACKCRSIALLTSYAH